MADKNNDGKKGEKPLTTHQKIKMVREENAKKQQEERLEAQKKREEKLSKQVEVASFDVEPLKQKIEEMKLAGQEQPKVDEPAKEKKIEVFTVEFEGEKWGLRARLTGGPVFITTVSKGQEGEQKGVKLGDLITKVNGLDIETQRDEAMAFIRKGGKATVEFKRVEGQGAQMIGVGGDATSVVKGENMSAAEAAKLQAMIGSAKNKDSVTFFGKQGAEEVIEEGVSSSSVVVIANCKDSKFNLKAMCTKVFMQDCENTSVVVDGRIITSTLEVYRCENTDLTFNSKIGTLQVDMCKKANIHFPDVQHFFDETGDKNTSMIVWAGCHELSVKVGPHAISTGFDHVKQEYHDLVEERSQFRIRLEKNTAGDFKLQQEKVVRLDNGFFSTMKEKAEFEMRQEANLKAMANSLGITMAKAKPTGVKCKRNQLCPHGSGRKFKDCCNRPDGICTGKAGQDMF